MSHTTALQDHITALLAAREAGDEKVQAREHAAVGKCYMRRNNYREAHRHYRKAVKLFRALGMDNHCSRSLNHLGVCLLMLEQPHQAQETLQKALDLNQNGMSGDVKCAILGNLGLVYSALNDYTKALDCHRQVLDRARQSGSKSLELQAVINLGDVHRQAGRLQQAAHRCQQALPLAQELSDQPSIIAIYDTLGMIASQQGNLKKARSCHHQAGETARKEGDLVRHAIALANEALALEGLTDLERALPAMERAHHIFQSLGSNYSEKTHKDLLRIRKGLETD